VEKVVTVSEVAAEKLKEVIAKQKNPKGTMLRIAFEGFG
jgi:Fe-S cluster assembly iron-binding protein IscA